MATQKMYPSTDSHPTNTTGKDLGEDKSDRKPTKDNTILVVFIGLLLDLLGKKI